MTSLDPRVLLPHRPDHHDPAAMRAVVEGRRILVTGAGGSIGSELCRQIARLDCASLLMLDRDENSLADVYVGLDSSVAHPILADILDARRLDEVLAAHRPELVFHAAAYKQVPLMETHVRGAVQNNVTGTRVLLQAAIRHEVEQFVLISTDKAVNPWSVMGATKRVAELMMRHGTHCSRTELITVRFGNVLGSSGSVVPRFLEQIRRGGPITVTDPRVTRFFILIPDAVRLVIAAAGLGGSGAMYVLEMGEPIAIVDLAHRVMRACGVEMPIEFIGLRPGEKLDEELTGRDEWPEATMTPGVSLIRNGASPRDDFAQSLARLEQLAENGTPHETIAQLVAIVPEFTPSRLHADRGRENVADVVDVVRRERG